MSILVEVNTKAPMPLMHPDAAERFNNLRQYVLDGSGVDFLAICGDVCRAANFVSNKDGVANRSWHKTGRAFDYDQNNKALVLVSEIINGKQYFITYLKTVGNKGELLNLVDYKGNHVSGYFFNFTKAAEKFGFHRIPAWAGWSNHWNRREFWHYQFDEGLTWDAAMLQLRGQTRPAQDSVIGLNDRGDEVRKIQTRLAELGFLPKAEIDGVFGAKSKAAVMAFQKSKNLGIDGLVGSNTRQVLFS